MARKKPYTLFITHAWRYHDDWNRLVDLIDASPEVTWHNYSIPWHDPAIKSTTEAGALYIDSTMESQIIPVQAVIVLSELFSSERSRRWANFAIQKARDYHKPLIAVPLWGETTISEELASQVDAIVGWSVPDLLAKLDDLALARLKNET